MSGTREVLTKNAKKHEPRARRCRVGQSLEEAGLDRENTRLRSVDRNMLGRRRQLIIAPHSAFIRISRPLRSGLIIASAITPTWLCKSKSPASIKLRGRSNLTKSTSIRSSVLSLPECGCVSTQNEKILLLRHAVSG